MSHDQGADIKTPQASLAVRGGMVEVTVGHACPSGGGSCEEIVLLNGRVSITTPAGTTELTRPGYSVTIDAEGHVSDPAPVTSSTLDDLESSFKSLPGQTGGAAPGSLPTDSKLQMALGDFHLPEHAPWGGLGAIGAHWAGKGVAQSHAQTINQATAAKTTQTTAALVAAAQNQTHSTCSSSGGTAPPPTGGPGGSSSASTGIFSKGFCVWGCVTPTYVSSTTPTNEGGSYSVTYKADFSSSGHGYFLVTFNLNSSSFTGTGTSTSTGGSGSSQGTEGMTVVYYPPSGGNETNTYNISFHDTYSYSGTFSASTGPTSYTISGAVMLNYVNISGITGLMGMSADSFFSWANGLSRTFNYSYP